MFEVVKLKKEIRKLKKENKSLKAYKEEILNKSIIQEHSNYIIPEELFKELWKCYANKPIEIISYGRTAIQYKNEIYYLNLVEKVKE